MPRIPSLPIKGCSEWLRGFFPLGVWSWHLVTKVLVTCLPPCSLSTIVNDCLGLSITRGLPWPKLWEITGNHASRELTLGGARLRFCSGSQPGACPWLTSSHPSRPTWVSFFYCGPQHWILQPCSFGNTQIASIKEREMARERQFFPAGCRKLSDSELIFLPSWKKISPHVINLFSSTETPDPGKWTSIPTRGLAGGARVVFWGSVDSVSLIVSFFFFFFGHAWRHGGPVPSPGSNPRPLQWKRWILTTGPPGKCPLSFHSPHCGSLLPRIPKLKAERWVRTSVCECPAYTSSRNPSL